jgi:hypothetical protein
MIKKQEHDYIDEICQEVSSSQLLNGHDKLRQGQLLMEALIAQPIADDSFKV